jgi:hypothetical protein
VPDTLIQQLFVYSLFTSEIIIYGRFGYAGAFRNLAHGDSVEALFRKQSGGIGEYFGLGVSLNVQFHTQVFFKWMELSIYLPFGRINLKILNILKKVSKYLKNVYTILFLRNNTAFAILFRGYIA